MPDWPFDQPPNTASITLRRIAIPEPGEAPRPILYVSHDRDGWQFLDGGPVTMDDAAVVGMGAMLRLDPTLAQVADLPRGWIATRPAQDAEWTRAKRT